MARRVGLYRSASDFSCNEIISLWMLRHCHFCASPINGTPGATGTTNARYSLMTMKIGRNLLIALLNQIYRIADDAYLVIPEINNASSYIDYIPLFNEPMVLRNLSIGAKTLLNFN